MLSILMILLCAAWVGADSAPASGPAAAREAVWPAIGGDQKPHVRWWWPGIAVDPADLSRLLAEMSKVGFGGVEVTPIYGVQGQEKREIQFLSPKYMQMLRFAATEAHRLGMSLDMATCTGWPFGGPDVPAGDVDEKVARDADGKLIAKPTHMKVKRAAPGGEGWVIDPYSPRAMTDYLHRFDGPLEDFPRDLIRDQFHDSFEYNGNWTADLPEKFKQMHGYDLRDHAAEVFGQGEPEQVGRVKRDYRATLGELHLEYIETWVKWCHAHGWQARLQAHGAPGNLLDLYGAADVPETETFGSTPFPIPGFRRDKSDIGGDVPQTITARFASSAAHVMGRRLVGCESFTWLREHFKCAMSMMKPEIDQMFLAGVNAATYHGSCYSPADAQWPGWQFYASVSFAPTNTLWHDLPAMNAYIARVQSVLQAGKPDNDLLVYFPIDDIYSDPTPDRMEIRFKVHDTGMLTKSSFGKTVQELIERGFSCDFISDAQLQKVHLDKCQFVAPGGGRYRAIVIPGCQFMPLPTLKVLETFKGAGAAVIFAGSPPRDVPGLGNLQNRRKEMSALQRQGQPSNEPLAHLSMPAGARREPIADHHIGFIRRRVADGYFYFLANLSAQALDQWVALSVPAESAAILDPLSGDAGLAKIRTDQKKREVYLQLRPGESLILRTFDSRHVVLPDWRYLEPDGPPAALNGPWQLSFTQGGPELPKSAKLGKLISWTDLGDPEAQRFAGTGRYRVEFDMPARKADDWLMDLGDVRESARVIVNGQSAGTLWSLPFRMPIGRFLEPGRNVLEIDVTNLAANRIRNLDRRGVDWKIMKDINIVDIHYKPFNAANWKLTSSGLLGPVTLTPMKNAD